MAGENNDAAVAPISDGEPERQRRERSTIEFPYGDLDDAIAVARAVHENYGLSCTYDQLAAAMGQTTTSGAFRSRMSTSRVFRLIDAEKGDVTLTDLGRRVVDASQERAARADAFLAVGLYEKVHEKYRGHLLPPLAALEREMQGFGVSSKQTGKARQAFERSAEQAGFFAQGTDRLVEPPTGGAPETRPVTGDASAVRPPDRPYGGGGGGFHPFIQGLLDSLPENDAEWLVRDRAKWLQTAANIFDLIYGTDGNITVTVNEERPQRAEA